MKEEKPYLQDLFEYMSNEHGLTLLQSQMQEIIDICMQQTDYNPLSSQLAAYKEALREIIEAFSYIVPNYEANHVSGLYNAIYNTEILIKEKAKTLIESERIDT